MVLGTQITFSAKVYVSSSICRVITVPAIKQWAVPPVLTTRPCPQLCTGQQLGHYLVGFCALSNCDLSVTFSKHWEANLFMWFSLKSHGAHCCHFAWENEIKVLPYFRRDMKHLHGALLYVDTPLELLTGLFYGHQVLAKVLLPNHFESRKMTTGWLKWFYFGSLSLWTCYE